MADPHDSALHSCDSVFTIGHHSFTAMPQTKKDRGKLLTQGQCRSNKNYLDVLSMHYERAPRFRRSRPSVAQSPFRYGGHNRSRGRKESEKGNGPAYHVYDGIVLRVLRNCAANDGSDAQSRVGSSVRSASYCEGTDIRASTIKPDAPSALR